jgi:hypothetical protein
VGRPEKRGLLKAAEDAGFDVLLTGDQSMPSEQNLSGRKLTIVTLSAIEWPIIREHLGKIAEAVDAAAPDSFTSVDCGSFARRTKPEGRHRGNGDEMGCSVGPLLRFSGHQG